MIDSREFAFPFSALFAPQPLALRLRVVSHCDFLISFFSSFRAKVPIILFSVSSILSFSLSLSFYNEMHFGSRAAGGLETAFNSPSCLCAWFQENS